MDTLYACKKHLTLDDLTFIISEIGLKRDVQARKAKATRIFKTLGDRKSVV